MLFPGGASASFANQPTKCGAYQCFAGFVGDFGVVFAEARIRTDSHEADMSLPSSLCMLMLIIHNHPRDLVLQDGRQIM